MSRVPTLALVDISTRVLQSWVAAVTLVFGDVSQLYWLVSSNVILLLELIFFSMIPKIFRPILSSSNHEVRWTNYKYSINSCLFTPPDILDQYIKKTQDIIQTNVFCESYHSYIQMALNRLMARRNNKK